MVTWESLLGPEKEKAYFSDLLSFVRLRREQGVIIFPPASDVFNAFSLCKAHNLKVVILGQDPYHGPKQAHGLCFSVLDEIKLPPSLRNIYKELCDDIEGFTMPTHGNLTKWAEQGVLLLNTVLTVEQGVANSHKGKGWEVFTDKVISQISEQLDSVVFLLWGAPAQQKIKLIDTSKHFVLNSVHPSPLSAYRGFFGCKHFSQTNAILNKLNRETIDWQIE